MRFLKATNILYSYGINFNLSDQLIMRNGEDSIIKSILQLRTQNIKLIKSCISVNTRELNKFSSTECLSYIY